MNSVLVSHFISATLMVVMPVGLGIFLVHRFKISPGIWWIGGFTFVASQIGHIPFNIAVDRMMDRGWLPSPPMNWALIFSAVFLGFSAGLWESWFRWIAYRWWAKGARSWRAGFVLGAGHGGMEAIILGILSFVTLANILYLKDKNLAEVLPSSQVLIAQSQLAAYSAQAWFMPLLGALERVFAMTFHITASILVLQAFLRNKILWVWIAVAWHAFMDGFFAVYLPGIWHNYSWWPLAVEGLLGILAIINIAILLKLKTPEPINTDSMEELPEPIQFTQLPPMVTTEESLERTKYNN